MVRAAPVECGRTPASCKDNAKKDGGREPLAADRPQRLELRIALAKAADAADGRRALRVADEAAIVGVVAHIQDRAPRAILRVGAGRCSGGDKGGKGKGRQSHGNLLSAMRRAGSRAMVADCGDRPSAALSCAFCSLFNELAKPVSAGAIASMHWRSTSTRLSSASSRATGVSAISS